MSVDIRIISGELVYDASARPADSGTGYVIEFVLKLSNGERNRYITVQSWRKEASGTEVIQYLKAGSHVTAFVQRSYTRQIEIEGRKQTIEVAEARSFEFGPFTYVVSGGYAKKFENSFTADADGKMRFRPSLSRLEKWTSRDGEERSRWITTEPVWYGSMAMQLSDEIADRQLVVVAGKASVDAYLNNEGIPQSKIRMPFVDSWELGDVLPERHSSSEPQQYVANEDTLESELDRVFGTNEASW